MSQIARLQNLLKKDKKASFSHSAEKKLMYKSMSYYLYLKK